MPILQVGHRMPTSLAMPFAGLHPWRDQPHPEPVKKPQSPDSIAK